MAGEGVSSKPAFITCTMHGWGQRVVCASTICAYQKLHLILQGRLPAECNNALHALSSWAIPPGRIERDVVDSVARRP